MRKVETLIKLEEISSYHPSMKEHGVTWVASDSNKITDFFFLLWAVLVPNGNYAITNGGVLNEKSCSLKSN